MAADTGITLIMGIPVITVTTDTMAIPATMEVILDSMVVIPPITEDIMAIGAGTVATVDFTEDITVVGMPVIMAGMVEVITEADIIR